MLVTEQRASGLVVARDSMDEAAVSHALKRVDRRLVLQKHARDHVEGGWVYKVVCVVSDTHAPVVYTWQDDTGRPLPLSSALVDAVQERHVGARNKHESEDAHNARLEAEVARRRDDVTAEIVADHKPYLTRSRVSVALGTGKPRYWRTENARPRSGGTGG